MLPDIPTLWNAKTRLRSRKLAVFICFVPRTLEESYVVSGTRDLSRIAQTSRTAEHGSRGKQVHIAHY